jgi:hypothetical protein
LRGGGAAPSLPQKTQEGLASAAAHATSHGLRASASTDVARHRASPGDGRARHNVPEVTFHVMVLAGIAPMTVFS